MQRATIIFLLLVLGALPFTVVAQTYSITVVKTGIGSGHVYDDVPYLDCGMMCTAYYQAGTTVTLYALADENSQFYGWSGPCSGIEDCVITLTSNVTVTARFGCIDGMEQGGMPCGINLRGVETTICVGGEWATFCSDPDECMADTQECDGNIFKQCVYNPATNVYAWEITPCNDGSVCTQDWCNADQGCIFNPAPRAGELCREAVDVCDEPEYCDGEHKACPADAIKPATEVCRASTGPCDADEYCDGSSKGCPPEDFASTNGLACVDAFDYTANETCANGFCIGTEVIGSCSASYDVSAFPYTLESTTVGRPSHITDYGANCPVASAPLGDAIVRFPVEAGTTYTISIVRHGGWTGFMAIIPICSVLYTNATCLNQNATEDSFTYTPLIGSTATLVVESLSGTGDFTLTIEREETPQPDNPITDEDVIEPTDEILSDEASSDEETTDEVPDDLGDEEEADDAPVITDDSPFIPDDAPVVTDDALPPDTDTTKPDTDTTKPDTMVDTDTEQPDEETDETVTDETGDGLLTDEDAVATPDEEKKSKDSGCGCSLVF